MNIKSLPTRGKCNAKDYNNASQWKVSVSYTNNIGYTITFDLEKTDAPAHRRN